MHIAWFYGFSCIGDKERIMKYTIEELAVLFLKHINHMSPFNFYYKLFEKLDIDMRKERFDYKSGLSI